jgi:hypothetical protein
LVNKKTLIAISSVIALAIIVFIVFLTNSSQDTITSESEPVDKNLLVGDWIRTDGSYLIKINNVNEDGTLEAQYFNPNPINVESAKWEKYQGNLKITIVLRDQNYPGSTYSINYLPDGDFLAGEYFQAVERSTFYVEFARNK